jgi:hypothetical protein
MNDDGTFPPPIGEPSEPDATPSSEEAEESPDTSAEERLRELLQAGAEDPGDPLGSGGDGFSAIYAVRGRVRRRRIVRGTLAVAAAAVVVAALVAVPGATHPRRPPTVTGPPPPRTYRLTGALVSFNACSDYLDYMRTQAEALVGPSGLQPYGSYGPNSYDGASEMGPIPAGGVGSSAAASGTSAQGSAGSALAPSGAPASASGSTAAFSQTNDQVSGVDEPDTVKTDGRVVLTLVGSTLRVLNLSAQVIGSVQLPGDSGGGFLLDGDRAVVLSSTAAVSGPVGVALPAIGPYQPQPAAGSTAQVTVVDLSDPAQPQVVRTFHFDGTVVAARSVDGQIRLVLRSDGPRVSFVDPSTLGSSGAATAANRALIASSTLADWLPAYQVENADGSTTARQPIAGCTSVARPPQASGTSTVSIFSLDPASPTPGPGLSVVAAGDTVYATADHVYVAGAAGAGPNPYAGAQPSGCCSVVPPRQASTRIYAFDTPASGSPVFKGAGSVPGWLIDSYAMDESTAGLLRVASTSQSPEGSTQSQITVLERSGGQLTAVGTVTGLGPDEFIRAVRFIGDQAYVVTYRTFDPLYVVNLSDARHPVLAGELDQPGFSEFLYPLPGGRLLGVGVQITAGEPSGLLVATYDVSDPARPRRIDTSVLASGFQYVAQGYDPHAFLYWAPADLALVSVPSDQPSYDGGAVGAGVAAYQIGGGGALTRTATLAHGTLTATRSVVIGSQVWALTAAGVITANLTDLPAAAWHSY